MRKDLEDAFYRGLLWVVVGYVAGATLIRTCAR